MIGAGPRRGPGELLADLLRCALSAVEPEVVAERVGAVVVIRSARHEDPSVRDFARDLPPGPASVVVGLGDVSLAAVVDRLAEVLAARQEPGEVRVLAPEGLAAVDVAVWRRLAERTGVTLLVPAGPVLVAGETLFACDGGEGVPGRWVRCAPGEPEQWAGPRHPAPGWQEGSIGAWQEVPGGVVVEHLPLGIVLRPQGAFPPSEWYAAAPEPHHLTVVVGVPDGPPVCAEDVAAYLSTLPSDLCATARLVSGDGRDVVTTGRRVAEVLGVGVTVVDGAPLVREGCLDFVLRDQDDRPTWMPYLREIRCLPGEVPALPWRWRAPHPGLVEHAPGVFRVTEHWVLGVMRSGLWLRAAGRPHQPVPVGAPVDPAVVTVAVGDPGSVLPDGVWTVLLDLLDRLEPSVLRRVRLSVLGVPSERGRETACAMARERGAEIRLSTSAGRTPG
ncbi:hypothetical protein [Saccharothrix sp. Mg75]|uniref:hypothetical protein n=1 Tax=Saccharothrix sp. Mg75 TaxID=3445357 RepID=UPI003EEF9F11